MKKVASLFVLAVFVPSLILAWLAVRSLRDQQFILERQQSLLYQNVADALVQDIDALLLEEQREFGMQVQGFLADTSPRALAPLFDEKLRAAWPAAEIGFAVSLSGEVLSPAVAAGAEARQFRLDNDLFLCNRAPVEVYWNIPKSSVGNNYQPIQTQQALKSSDINPQAFEGGQKRSVLPQQSEQTGAQWQVSKVAAAEAEFRQLIGDASEGIVARFVQNKLNVLLWYRSPRDPQIVFGAQLALAQLIEQLRPVAGAIDAALRDQICVAFLDDNARPVALSHAGFETDWKRPFAAAEIGEALPHWEVAVYLLNPASLSQSAAALKTTLGGLIALLLVAIGVGGWLIFADVKRQMLLAQQKTDFVSNVSHELKTPLTSIRMFSELLAEGRVGPEKQRSYLNIITAETSRLTRLINNVLDFARIDRGEKKYNFRECDLNSLVREAVDTFRPQLEGSGFALECTVADAPLTVNGDRDALSQVIVNLLSNAEKYSGARKEVAMVAERQNGCVILRVLDRGMGVPHGCDEKIFEQFYRAQDSLNSGIQGAGLGLTLARQIARAHQGDLTCEAREGGGSCFTLRLPLIET